jgi:hypothetical protein
MKTFFSDNKDVTYGPPNIKGKGLFYTKYKKKRSILNPELVEVRRNEPQTPNPSRLCPELCNPGLNQTLDLFLRYKK